VFRWGQLRGRTGIRCKGEEEADLGRVALRAGPRVLEYYRRRPKAAKYLRGLQRIDAYVLMQIRLGTDVQGHDQCPSRDK